MKKPYKNGILLAATSNSAFAIGAMVANIAEVMSGEVDIFYIVHDRFTQSELEAFARVAGGAKIKFISFTKDDFAKRLEPHTNNQNILNSPFFSRWTHMAYGMFEPLLLLDECECIVYLDFDILLLKGIGELFRLKGYHFSAHRGKSLLNPTLRDYNGEFKDCRVYRSGIVAYYDTIPNPKECYNQIYNYSAKYGANDQGVFSLLILDNKFKVKNLGYEYTSSTFWRKSIGASIIHAWGRDGRFWNNELVYQFWGEIWDKYYQKWLKCGGSEYKGGFICKANYAIERIRYHLAYKLGYAMIENHTTIFGKIKLPFILLAIALKHRRQKIEYHKIIQTKPNLKVPPIEHYEDYRSALAEKQSAPYRLGQALIKATKTWYKGGLIKLYFEINEIKRDKKR
ncbi:glycosyl transferase [Campylobacter lanienae]|uniref:glycosyl transferase n=1 Tax=Campylobacter lanienae TaxID=75658 RepID=UPI000BB40C11|nr:glycosyl transferase [Campylobacter lanienae]